MLILMLKYIKILKSTPTCFDLNRLSSGSWSVTELFENLKKNTEFKILTINPGVVAAIHVAGVHGDPCGAVQRTRIDCQDFKFSVFFKFLNYSVTLTRCRPTP